MDVVFWLLLAAIIAIVVVALVTWCGVGVARVASLRSAGGPGDEPLVAWDRPRRASGRHLGR